MENLKIRVNSADESKEAQELFFSLGYGFEGNEVKEIQDFEYVGEFYFFAYGDDCDLTHSCDSVLFTNKPHREITLPELRAMVKPMKEYLDANRDYEFVLSTEKDDGFIKIPEGAIRARFYPHDPDELEFENALCQWWHDEDNEWINYENYSNTLEHSRVVWQREQDEPFITPETTLNEHCGGTVKSYIDKFHVSSIDVNPSKEIHGTVKTKPDFNFGAAQASGGAKDNVNHPSHYTQGKVECIDALESATIGKSGIEAVCVANVVKYLWRYEEKNGLEDVRKAQFYLNRLITTLENNNG